MALIYIMFINSLKDLDLNKSKERVNICQKREIVLE